MHNSAEMNFKISKKNDMMFFFLLTFLYVSFYLPMGSAIPTLALLGYYLIKNKFKVFFKISFFVVYCISFALFCYLSYFWAKDTYYVMLYANHILKSMFGMMVIYLCVQKKPAIDLMLKVIVWGGYVIMFNMIAFYGINGLISMLNEAERMTNDLMNANQFALCISYALVIHAFFGIEERWTFAHLLMIPAALLLAVSGSRKGLIVLIGGVLCLTVLTIWKKEHSIKAILKIILGVLFVGAGFVLVLNLPAFRVIKERMENFFVLLSGDSNVDKSLITRSSFIEIGWSIFKKYPLLGVGIDNARLYNYRNVYLHNNFIEMLADGGLVGFSIYYSLYVYLFVGYFKTRKTKSKYYAVCFVLLIFMTMIHYAFVAYKVSGEYYMLLLCYMQLKQSKANDSSSGLEAPA